MPLECTHFDSLRLCDETTFNERGGGSKQTQLQDMGNRESPCSVWKATGVNQIACFLVFFFACFGCYWPLFFHISNRGWGQLPGHAANVCNWPLLTSKTRCSTGLEPLHTSLVMSGLILGCLDWTGRPYCWARHVSSSYTSWLFLLGLCQRHGLQDCCQWHRLPQEKRKKILESVRSVTVDIIAATWRELRKRLVVIIEHNDDHVEAYHHWFLSCFLMRWCPLNSFLGINRTIRSCF